MRILSEEQSAALVDEELGLAAAEAAFLATVSGSTFPVVIAHGSDPKNRFTLKSGATSAAAGVKLGSYWPDNDAQGLPRHSSTVILLDQRTGRVAAVVEAAAANAYRTAAADALAVKALARPDAATLTVIGTGHQALYEARAVARVRPVQRILVAGRKPAAAAWLAERVQAATGLPTEASGIEQACCAADIIVTATTATTPLFAADWVGPGTHVSAMGADAHGKQEAPPDLFSRARLFCDLPDQSQSIGEFPARTGQRRADPAGRRPAWSRTRPSGPRRDHRVRLLRLRAAGPHVGRRAAREGRPVRRPPSSGGWSAVSTLLDPDTPFAVVDRSRLDRNIARLDAHLRELGAPLRLHVKTAKSRGVAARVHPDGPAPITVSTLAEAEYFADAGYTDILYAVGIEPGKLDRIFGLRQRGVDLIVLLDSLAQAEHVAEASRRSGTRIPEMIEIDCDGHRGGIAADEPDLLAIGRALDEGGAELRGVLDHAGESYYAATPADQRAAADGERQAAVRAAEQLRVASLPCPVVSVGSTPTAHAAVDLAGVTEVRAGNYVFFDLVMAGIGVCTVDDLALSVVVTVIGHRPDQGWIVTDGGWMATSRDRGTARQPVDQGYGLVTDLAGRLIPDLLMADASQEHGLLSIRPGSGATLPELPIGTRLRILPNHACATAAQHRQYQVIASNLDVPGDADPAPAIEQTWDRCSGW